MRSQNLIQVIFLSIILLISIFFIPGCNFEKKDLTLAVILSGRNSLEKNQGDNLRELLTAYKGYNNNSNLFILIDQGGYSSTNKLFSIKGPRLYHNGKQINLSTIFDKDEKINLNSMETIRKFMTYVKEHSDSKYYVGILSGHGMGFLEKDMSPTKQLKPWDPIYPKEYYEYFKPSVINEAFSGLKYDNLILDLCFMGDLETLWALKDTAKYLVYSQIALPSSGMDYRLLLKRLDSIRFLTPKKIAYETVEAYRETFKNEMFPVNISAIEYGESFNNFTKLFEEYVEKKENKKKLEEVLLKKEYLPGYSEHKIKMIDLKSLLLEIKYNNFIINKFKVHNETSGLSIYYPKSKDVYIMDSFQYKKVALSLDYPNGWVKVIQRDME